MGHPTETLRDTEVLGAIAGLEKMVAAGGGDLEAKAALAATCYTFTAKAKGVAWAEERVGPIIQRLREHPNASADVETILHGLPDRARLEDPSAGLGAALEALLASAVEPRGGEEALVSVDRLMDEVRRLRTDMAVMRSMCVSALPIVRHVAAAPTAAPTDMREAARQWAELAETFLGQARRD